MGRFVVLRERGDSTALLVDRELLTVSVLPCDANGEQETDDDDLEVVPVWEPTEITSRMYYHQGTDRP